VPARLSGRPLCKKLRDHQFEWCDKKSGVPRCDPFPGQEPSIEMKEAPQKLPMQCGIIESIWSNEAFSLSILSVGMFLTSAVAPLNDRPGDLGYLRNQCVQESWHVRASRKIGALPSHRGVRSDWPAASAAIERFLTSPRCSGYGRISTPFRFNSSITRL